MEGIKIECEINDKMVMGVVEAIREFLCIPSRKGISLWLSLNEDDSGFTIQAEDSALSQDAVNELIGLIEKIQ
jgi:hypothetical protein